MPDEIYNQEVARRFFIKVLQLKGYNVKTVNLYNKNRHMLMETQHGNFWMVFKKAHYMKFNQEKAGAGAGESINTEFCKIALHYKATIVFVYPNHTIYYTTPEEIINNSIIRTQQQSNYEYNYGKMKEVKEETFSFDRKIMKNFEEYKCVEEL